MAQCTKCEGRTFYRLCGRLMNCECCDEGEFPGVKEQLAAIFGLVNGHKRTLRSTRPEKAPENSDQTTRILHRRAYYVWRLARYYAKVDRTEPYFAMRDIEGDPCVEDLQRTAQWFAQTAYGS